MPGRYDVVVGNPPYITVKDKKDNERYRGLYTSCKGTYALTVPFMERFFGLARLAEKDRAAGWVGQITSNSFMKREFGSKLIEDFLKRQDLRLIVDSSGAYIPGHGTPTVILVGKHQPPAGDTVRAVLGIRGEPGRPEVAAEGLVWRSITGHVDAVGHEDEYTSTADLARTALATHPWSLGGGAAAPLTALMEDGAPRLEGRLSGKIGFASFPGVDDAFFSSQAALNRSVGDKRFIRAVITGDVVRDWAERDGDYAFAPYDQGFALIPLDPGARWYRRMWPFRSTLGGVTGFEGQTRAEAGDHWWGWYRWVSHRYRTPLSIAFAEVATHNHFVLDWGGKVFKQTAPVIKLPEGASEDDHLALLGALNSSTACFWLKQKCHNKGSTVDAHGARQTLAPWEDFYQFNGTKVKDFPLPTHLPLARARRLDLLAQELAESFARCFQDDAIPTDATVAQAWREHDVLRGEMIAVQEELDWEVYRAYGITGEELTLPEGAELPRLRLGERAFEIALARTIATGAETSAWFARHGSTPITEIPAEWPAPYRELVQRRLDLIASDRFVGLLERPEYKRRWAEEPWDKRVTAALRTWLLDRLERRDLWFDRAGRPRPLSVAQLADRVGTDADLVSVLNLWAGRKDADVTDALEKLLADEVVPYLAAHRLKDTGLRKRAEWERTWDLQRAEDRGEAVDPIPVPPKYTSADFRRPSYWSHRGKLDVPKERFISYPGGGRATDPTTLLGWAGWDHAQQSLALGILIQERESDGATDEVLIPLVAGMAELQPWVDQWHDEMSDIGLNLAEYTSETLRHHLASLGVTETDLRDWRPPAATRGRRGAARSASPKGS